MRSKIGELVRILMTAKARGAVLNNKSKFEIELNTLIGVNHTVGKKNSSAGT